MWWSRKTRDKTLSTPFLIFDFQLFLKLHRTHVAQTRMSSDAIVITFDVAEDFRSRLFDWLEMTALDKFGLESGKETLRLCVVITISLAAHWLPKAVNIQQPSIFNRRILRTAIRVNNRAAFYQTPTPRPVQSVQNELRRHPWWHLPADNSSRQLILKCRQITELSVLQRQICNVTDNHLTLTDRLVQLIFQQIRSVAQAVLRIGGARHVSLRTNCRQRLLFHHRTSKSSSNCQTRSFQFSGNPSRSIPSAVQIENLFDRSGKFAPLLTRLIRPPLTPSVKCGFSNFQHPA